ncbi:hypothetical protein BaRGS_00033407 [Batillaria attramentaria]|uniref:C2H2-type domain-containing protein n=1 Tax=Batillaria attramentaria TaxID=370345 RepID=A0ABD0JK54_9CAEN
MDLKTQHTPPTVGPFSLPLHVFLGWKRAGNAKGLKTDAEIAAFLVQLYEDGQNGVQSAVECPSCNSPLSLYCTKCQLQPQIPISSTAHSTADPGSENDIRKETFDRPSDGETLASPSQTGSFREADNLSLNESTEKDGDTPASQPEDKFFVLSDPNDSNDAPWVESTLDTDELSVGDFKEEPLAGVDSTKKSSFDPSWVKLNLDTGNVPVDDVKKEPDSSAVKKAAGSNNVSPTRQARKGLKKLTSTKKRLKNATSVVRSKTKVSLSQQKIDEQKDKDGTVSTKQRSPKDKFVCKELGCSEVCHSYAEFVEHRKTHNSTTPYRCPECGLRFAVRDALTMHVRIHYKCDECNVSYCCRKNIKRHMISKHINKDANIIQCQECGLTFTHKNGFHAHMKLQHSKEHKCSECGKTYEDPVALKWHMTEHAQCKLCGKTFFSKASLSCHMTNVHESASRHPKTVCHICGSRVTHMKAHMRIHTVFGSPEFNTLVSRAALYPARRQPTTQSSLRERGKEDRGSLLRITVPADNALHREEGDSNSLQDHRGQPCCLPSNQRSPVFRYPSVLSAVLPHRPVIRVRPSLRVLCC